MAKVREILSSTGKWKAVDQGNAVVYPDARPLEIHDLVVPTEKETRPEQAASAPAAAPRPAAPPPAPAPPSQPPRFCPFCENALHYIVQYDAWYCYPCRKYPDFEG